MGTLKKESLNKKHDYRDYSLSLENANVSQLFKLMKIRTSFILVEVESPILIILR